MCWSKIEGSVPSLAPCMRLLCSMRIAVLSVFPPFRGGIAQFNDSMCAAFDQNDHDVLRVNFKRQYPRLLFPGESQYDEASFPLENVLLDSINPLTWRKTARFIVEYKPDALVVPFWQPFLLPALTAVSKHVKLLAPEIEIIGLLHNATSHESQSLGSYFISRYLKTIDRAWTLSEAVASHPLVTGNQTRVQQLFHPVYNHFPKLCDKRDSRKRLGLPTAEDVHIILFFGLIRAYKGLDILLEALPRTQNKGKPVHLVIAGEAYENWAKYESIIKKHEIQDIVHVHNYFIANEDVPVFFGAVDAVCLPYRSASQSGVTAIAIQYGIPVVASSVGGLVEYFKGNSLGRLCPPNDPSALSNAILSRLGAPTLMPEEINEVRDRFSWDAFSRMALKTV